MIKHLHVEIEKRGPRDGSGWYLVFRGCNRVVGEAVVQVRGHCSVEITWIKVCCGFRRQGLGCRMVEEIRRAFPDKKVYAWNIIESARPFWDPLIAAQLVKEDA